MRKPGKITKSEIALLAVTLAFLGLVLAVHLSGRTVRSRGSYTVTPRYAGEAAREQVDRIDINTADETLLGQLPGIGPTLAGRIVADREENGPFASVDELSRVSGIGEKTVEALRPFAVAGENGEEADGEDSGGG